MVHQTAITLSHHLNDDNSLSRETKARVDEAISLHGSGYVTTISLSGGHAGNEIKDITHAGAMKRYAISEGVRPADLYSEEKSLDTVGQAVFSKRKIVVPNNWNEIVVVSHDYHIARVKRIFDFVYGEDFNLEYVGIPTKHTDDDINRRERDSLEAFLRTFDDTPAGNDAEILNTMIHKHPLYSSYREHMHG